MPDHLYMARAIQLARKGIYTTSPNPLVGCVITQTKIPESGQGSSEHIIAEGWHQRAGGPHAEIVALDQVGEAARGATAYVTLEPCSHIGKTGPCSEALIKAGVAKVVVAMTDPNPLVSGQGIARLRQAGIEVVTGVLEGEALALNPGFISRMTRQRPWVQLKLAQSLDGRTAMASGESQWITGPAARLDVQRLRASACAIAFGVGSILKDDPQMTVRPDTWQSKQPYPLPVRQPLRVVLDTHLKTPQHARCLSADGETLLVHGSADSRQTQALASQKRVSLLELPGQAANGIDLAALMPILAARGVNRLLVESGPKLAGAFVQAGLVDELVLYIAPKLMGDEAMPLLNLPGLQAMSQAIEWQFQDVRQVGADLRLILTPTLESGA